MKLIQDRRGRAKLIIAILSVVIFSLCCTFIYIVNAKKHDFSMVTSCIELTEMMNKHCLEDIIIDLRDNRDYESSHLIGSINIPYDEEGGYLTRYLQESPMKKKNIYLICYSGKRSAQAFNLLYDMGYHSLHVVTFGYDEYVQLEGETESEGADVCECNKNN